VVQLLGQVNGDNESDYQSKFRGKKWVGINGGCSMARLSRLRPSDKVEIIDRTAPDFGKTGEVIHIWSRPEITIGKPTGSKVKVYCQVKLNDTGTMKEFPTGQVKKIP
jgi:hypothetical protein